MVYPISSLDPSSQGRALLFIPTALRHHQEHTMIRDQQHSCKRQRRGTSGILRASRILEPTAARDVPAAQRHRWRLQSIAIAFAHAVMLLLVGETCSAFFLVPALGSRQRRRVGPTRTCIARPDNSLLRLPSQEVRLSSRDSHGTLQRMERKQQQPQYRNKQRTANTRKTQLRWIFQSLEKMQTNGTLKAAFPNTSSGNHNTIAEDLLSAIKMLAQAATTREVTAAGRQIEAAVARSHLLSEGPSSTKNHEIFTSEAEQQQQQQQQHARTLVLERIIKATAMTGLHTLAWNITQALLVSSSQQHQQPFYDYVPSTTVQEALCSSWRRAGKVRLLREFFAHYMAHIVASKAHPTINSNATTNVVSIAAFNTFLAALCEPPPNHHKQQKGHNKNKKKIAVKMIPPERLEEAVDWLLIRAPQDLHVSPDDIAYATLLQAASKLNNQTLSDRIWNAIDSSDAPKNIVAFNARLKLLLRRSSGTSSNCADTPILEFWDAVLLQDSNIQPDRYTIDLMLLPLVRAGRVGQIEELLDDFFANHTEQVIADTMAAFLVTLTRGGEIAAARALFETYLAPSLAPVLTAQAGSMLRLIKPTTRHFNVLLAGYRQEAERASGKTNSTDAAIHLQNLECYQEAWNLFKMMHSSSPTARPDSYTITSMLGLCRSTQEVVSLLVMSLDEFNLSVSGAVYRAAITAFGKLGDPSSACWVFASFREEDKWDQRSLNALMAALGKAFEAGSFDKVDASASAAAKALSSYGTCADQRSILKLVDHKTCIQGVQELLDAMRTRKILDHHALPLPSSQTYCIAATMLQYGEISASMALDMFKNATSTGVPADGRFVNAVLRCFGDDIDRALSAWKSEIRGACLAYENRSRTKPVSRKRIKGKNLVAAYHGLLHVCGRANRPDIAVRLVYAMNKEGLEPTELSLNCYLSGKRLRESITQQTPLGFVQKLKLIGSFESLLYVECMKYDRNDKRRAKERRVRIII